MKHNVMFALWLLVGLSGRVVGADLRLNDAREGVLPANWIAAKTGEGEGSVWKIVADQSSPDGGKALAQVSADGPRPLFNLCVADAPSLTDVELTIAAKAVAGKIDQGGGPVWRYQDANNYYIARVNPLENNYRVYKVVKGLRTELDSADVKAPANKWHTIRVDHKGKHIRCYLNGKLLLDVTDDAIQKAGKIGVWTKADAQTQFAGIKVSGK